jgi:DNA repair exonuclease SbcCD ATPase subunit
LNRLINSYLSLLNPDITVEVSTVTRLKGKKDQFRERFAIEVFNANGARSYEGNSDGEKQMVNLAVALAFNALCRAMARGSVNFLWMDEPFESLDESSAERAIELCNAFSSQVDNLFITTHNWAIKDLVTSGILVEKRNGMAIAHQDG